MMLADAAQAVGGKLFILGGGWSVCGPEPLPMALAVKIEVPWDQANLAHAWRLELLDSDGAPVLADTPDGARPIEVQSEFEVGRPAGVKPGTPLDLAFAISFGPLALPAATRYEWRLSIDDESEDDWRVAFTKLASAPGVPG